MSRWQEPHAGAGSSSRAGAGEARVCGYPNCSCVELGWRESLASPRLILAVDGIVPSTSLFTCHDLPAVIDVTVAGATPRGGKFFTSWGGASTWLLKDVRMREDWQPLKRLKRLGDLKSWIFSLVFGVCVCVFTRAGGCSYWCERASVALALWPRLARCHRCRGGRSGT